MPLRFLVPVLVAAALATAAAAAEGIGLPARAAGSGTAAAGADTLDAWSFPVGERMEYSVTWGGARIGRSVLAITGIDTISGTPAYRASLHTEGGPPFYRLEDRLTSWIRPEPFATLRFDQNLRQGGYTRNRRHVMDPGAGTYTRYDLRDGAWVVHEEEAAVEVPEGALDEVAFFYFARLSELEVGSRYEYERYFKESGNPVVLEVLRRERIRVPAGTFNTIVVRPIIQTSGLFAEGGEAEIFLTDDERRIPVRVKTRMSIGTANFYLTEYENGDGGALIDPAPERAGAEAEAEGS